jgi:ankyrin repeat protein
MVIRPTAQFIHESVRYYLLRGGLATIVEEDTYNLEGHCHERLKECCERYILSTQFGLAKEDYPLLMYAMDGVLYHANTAIDYGVSQKTFVRNFPYEAWVRLYNLFGSFEIKVEFGTGDPSWVFALSHSYNLLDLAIENAASAEALNKPLPTADYRTILGLAVDRGDDHMLDMLLARGVDPNSLGPGRQRCLRLAIYKGSASIVKRLMNAGARLELDGADDLQLAVLNGSTIVKAILDEDLSSSAGWRDPGYTDAFIKAVQTGHLEVACMFIERLEMLDPRRDGTISMEKAIFREILGSALVAASRSGRSEILEMLLKGEFDIRHEFYADNFRTALHAASMQGSVENVEILLQHGAQVNVCGGPRGSALQLASLKGSVRVVRVLLHAGANVNTRDGEYGTALQAACHSGSKEVAELLLSSGADVNTIAGEYGTALQAASYWGHMQLVDALLQAGAVIDARGGEFGCALEAAIAGESWAAADQLSQLGADESALSVQASQDLGCTRAKRKVRCRYHQSA